MKNNKKEQPEVIQTNAQVPVQTKGKKKKKRKKAPVIIAIIVVVLFVIYKMVSCGADAAASMAVVTTTNARRGDLQDSVNISGTVMGQKKVTVYAQASGYVAEVPVQVGDSVAEGDVVLTYDLEALEKQLSQAQLQYTKGNAVYQSAVDNNNDNKAKLTEANTNLKVLEQQIKDYTALVERLQEELTTEQNNANNGLVGQSYALNKQATEIREEMAALTPGSPEYLAKEKELQNIQDSISQVQMQQQMVGSSDRVKELQKQLTDAQKQLAEFETNQAKMESQQQSSKATIWDAYDKEQLEADKALTDMSLEDAQGDYELAKQGIVAEYDAVVTACNAEAGAAVSRGMQLMTLESTDKIKVSFDVTRNMLEKLSVGQKAEVTIFDEVYEGEVARISGVATTTQMGQSTAPTVNVEVNLTEEVKEVVLGLDAKVVIFTNKAENALLIPVEAINADREGDFVYAVENGVVVRKNIVCGISGDAMTEVLEGIIETDVIVLSSLTNVEEGMIASVLPSDMDLNALTQQQ